jgi:hypothetical protein
LIVSADYEIVYVKHFPMCITLLYEMKHAKGQQALPNRMLYIELRSH